ncbi:riboflavin biosynthesis protein [Bacteroidia bacterium]|nr:riboflavin biosynthesis protein [Bacteroidia bacterium]
MEIIYINNSSRIETETAATVGFFDGVHRGHRFLIDRLKRLAADTGLKTAVITFPVHPRKVLQQDYQPKLLNTLAERLRQLASTGIDYCYVIDFTKEFSETTAPDFIQGILHNQLHLKTLLVGYDHRFGKGGTGEYAHYAAYGKACGMNVVPAEQLPEKDRHTSSTAIRRLLSEGKMKEVAESLSYNYTLEGEVIHGNQMGRTIGFPTANIALDDKEKMIPQDGVYAVRVLVENENYSGMAYIGKRPTVSSAGEQRIEVNIFDFDRDIYSKRLRAEFVDFLRPDVHFDGLDALKKQLAQDRENALNVCAPSFAKSD